MDSNEHYLLVLNDLEEQRKSLKQEFSRIERECDEIEQLIAGIKKRVPVAPIKEAQLALMPQSRPSVIPLLTGMSIRWAILTVLGNYAEDSMSVGEIVLALGKGGLGGEKLRSNVSAVLSRMVSVNEVVNSGNSYKVTERGKGALAAIQMTRSAPTG